MASIKFRLLGPVEVLLNGRALGPTTAQQRRVLAMLLLALGRVVPIDRLTTARWPSDPPASAQNTVRVYVTRLRRLFAADPSVELVTVDPDRLDVAGLDPGCAVAQRPRPGLDVVSDAWNESFELGFQPPIEGRRPVIDEHPHLLEHREVRSTVIPSARSAGNTSGL
ncbi:AfsR/SARP family transcriptional regulator [Nonomuraea jabiensis]|uniref:AfsR/SARP family transcriptional regulator n=1 Tax=Nonomuraea jabiensis TaxID=882448 RepID=UPI0036CE462E